MKYENNQFKLEDDVSMEDGRKRFKHALDDEEICNMPNQELTVVDLFMKKIIEQKDLLNILGRESRKDLVSKLLKEAENFDEDLTSSNDSAVSEEDAMKHVHECSDEDLSLSKAIADGEEEEIVQVPYHAEAQDDWCSNDHCNTTNFRAEMNGAYFGQN